jgi:hypothetical protein
MKAVFDRACGKQPLKQQNNSMESEEQDNPKTHCFGILTATG